MTNILKEISEYAKIRVINSKKVVSLETMISNAYSTISKGDFLFEKALQKEGMSFICECKKASPSKGIIAKEFPYLSISKEYEEAKADAISVLTEPKWFLGDNKYLKEIAKSVSIPCLRKDFVVDEYMIYEAKMLNASAVLLICSILDDNQLKSYLKICDDLRISALFEAHDKEEVERAVNAGARIIGVNNRNLKDFTVDPTNCLRLRQFVPRDVLFVAESGIKERKDVEILEENGVDAILIGETLMKADNKKQMLDSLRGVNAN